MFAPAYLDYNATTPLEPAVLAAMLPWLEQRFGNASSRHEYGRAARKAIDEARQQVAYSVGAHPTEVVFTSGGSESNNLFIKGAAANLKPGLIAVSAIEHPCVREPAKVLKRQGWSMHEIAVDAAGRIDMADYAATLEMQPKLVSVMLANNETGVLQDVAQLAAQAKDSRAWFHTDAVQALGKVPVDFRELGVHGLTVSAHKIGGPKGSAALIVDKRVEISPLISGGGHERGLRSGTENVAAIVGFGAACEIALQRLDTEPQRLRILRDELERGLQEQGARIFGAASQERLPNTLYFSIPGIDGETLVGKLDRVGFAVASGAACSSANPEPSHVLMAMGVESETARGAVRISLGAGNTPQQVKDFLVALREMVGQLKGLTSLVT
ncbi:MAG TPA: cysteine desulfurase family protein [Rhodocyclaceae bacterium]|nr:cysteine desulfurase family protein [Rhodocyclaceae bacterium]